MSKYKAGQKFETNTSGVLELIEKVDVKKFKVKFLETGHEVVANIDNIVAGKVLDPIYKKRKQAEWKPHYAEYENNAGHKLVAFAKRGNKIKVRFIDTGYETEAYIENVKKGKISDPYSLTFLGIGCLGEFPKVSYWKQAKQLWSNMMKRCYNPKDYMGYFGTAFVGEDWTCFSNFLSDLPELENFDKWIEGKNGGPVYNLDKDLKVAGNKTYCKDMCAFVTEYENKSAGAVNARLLDKTNGRYGYG